MKKAEKNNKNGFTNGIEQVKRHHPMAVYTRCIQELRDVILSTEKFRCSISCYYHKRNGHTPLTIAEETRIDEVFAKYGITDWRGTVNNDENNNNE